MVTRKRRRGFTVVELIVVITIIAILMAMLPLMLANINTTSRQGHCISNVKQLSLAIINFESAHRRYPLAVHPAGPNNNTEGVVQGNLSDPPGSATLAGYSWITQILPELEEVTLYDELKEASENFTLGPFHAEVVDADGNHLSMRPISMLYCRSFRGELFSKSGDYTTGEPANGNYVCIPATHAALIDGADDARENGIIVGPQANQGRGIRIRDVSDGTSKTILICESREEEYASWIDGQVTWIVPIRPVESARVAILSDGKLGYSGDGIGHALQYGDKNAATPEYYYPVGTRGWGGQGDRELGPSSAHRNIVIHGFADGHVTAISSDIDATVYMRLFTRNGGENVLPIDYE